MKETLRRYDARLWLKRHQKEALALSKSKISEDVHSYTFGCCVLLFSPYANYRQILKSIDMIKKEVQIARRVELQKKKEIRDRKEEFVKEKENGIESGSTDGD